MPGYDEAKRKRDLIQRDVKGTDPLGTAVFLGTRVLEPFLQYKILSNEWGTSLIERLGGGVLPLGPPLITNTPLDVVGLSPYRSILLAMSVGSVVKQNFWLLAIGQEKLKAGASLSIGAFNAVANSLNSLFFICSQTSASVNGEHFPQTPLIVGASLYVSGILIETISEIQRAAFKKDPKNKGKVYTGGLFGLSRHINYFGYTLWRGGYALAAGGWIWGAVVAALNTSAFIGSSIPVLQGYLEDKYGEQYEQYKQATPYKYIPYIW